MNQQGFFFRFCQSYHMLVNTLECLFISSLSLELACDIAPYKPDINGEARDKTDAAQLT